MAFTQMRHSAAGGPDSLFGSRTVKKQTIKHCDKTDFWVCGLSFSCSTNTTRLSPHGSRIRCRGGVWLPAYLGKPPAHGLMLQFSQDETQQRGGCSDHHSLISTTIVQPNLISSSSGSSSHMLSDQLLCSWSVWLARSIIYSADKTATHFCLWRR